MMKKRLLVFASFALLALVCNPFEPQDPPQSDRFTVSFHNKTYAGDAYFSFDGGMFSINRQSFQTIGTYEAGSHTRGLTLSVDGKNYNWTTSTISLNNSTTFVVYYDNEKNCYLLGTE
jgi:hypothetical protein